MNEPDGVLAKDRILEVLTAAQSLWQSPFVERLIGSVRRECLDHVVVLNERRLGRILAAYFAYYHRARTHLSLDKDAPHGRPVEGPEAGRVVPLREVGGRSIWYETDSGMTDDDDDDALCDTSFNGIGYALQVEMLDGVTHAAWRNAAELKKATAKRPPGKKARAE